MRIIPMEWHVGIRAKISKEGILQDRNTAFVLIPNTRKYEAADPFVFRYGEHDYVFAELIDKSNGKGCIGYTIISNGKARKWEIIIQEEYHLSFPNIFEHEGDIYIMPESSEAQSLYCYKAVDFPISWVKCEPILNGIRVVDTAIFRKEKQSYCMTYELITDGESHGRLWMYLIDEDYKSLKKIYSDPISMDDSLARLGGGFFKNLSGETIRVSQDCKDGYGVALVFSIITELTETTYSEKEILRLTPSDIPIKPRLLCQNGLHTYNCNDFYEVVDVRTLDFSISRQVLRIMGKFRKYRKKRIDQSHG